MDKPAIPENESERLNDLLSLCLLDTPREERFDRLTRMAQKFFSVDFCLVSLVDEHRQWFKSNQGLDATETPRDISFCGHAILSSPPLIVEDTLLDARFSDNPLVTGPPNIRFYAGVPLVGANNFRIGTLCIIDSKPKKLTNEEISTLVDISLLIQSEILSAATENLLQKFREGDSKLLAIINNVVDGIITISEKGIVETLNPAALDLFGYSKEEVIGNNVKMLMPSPYRDNHDDYLKNYLNTGTAKIIGIGREVTGKKKDGSTFPMELAVSEMILNGQRGFTGIVRDISHRKSQEELQARYAAIVKTSNDAIISNTPDGLLTSWNLSATKMFGYGADEVIGKDNAILIPTTLLAEQKEIYSQLNSGNAIENIETQRKTKQGNILDVSISFSPIKNEKGEITEISSIFRDITEQKKSTKELLLAKEAAEQASNSKTQFVANMSHEIRTPLNAILGMSRLISNTNLSIEQSNYLEMIESSSKSLLGVINDILDFSKVEAGRMELSNNDFYLSDLMRSIANVMSINAGDKNLELVIDIDQETPSCFRADIQKIQQILINLVSNSIKFTEQGEIVVSISSQDLSNDVYRLKFIVADTGIGMSEEQQNNLFSAFTQADTSITRRYGGTGLGLAITKKFVELMNGTIQISSSLGQGTKVEFEIELEKGTAKDKDPLFKKTGEQKQNLVNLHILLIDDNESSQRAISQTIESLGWTVDALNSGKEVHTWLKKKLALGIQYNLVLIDTTLPDENPSEVANTIESDFLNYALPCAFMGNAFGHDQIQRLTLPTTRKNILIKPITSSSLFDYVSDTLHQTPSAHSEQLETTNINDLKGVHILLVEDNAMNQVVAQCMLEDSGATLDIASNGEEAIKMLGARDREYDIVLMDIQMPVMDGFTATKIIRNELKLQLPVLALSAGVLNSERESCTNAGMNDFVAKPIDPEILFTTIDRHLSSPMPTRV
ncbi:hypothetical protein NBRC116493_25450 [Aurantivibrio infirmus]